MTNIESLTRTVRQGNADVNAIMVFDASGTILAAAGADEALMASATAMLVPLRDMLERTIATLGCGELRSTLMQGSGATIGLTDVDGVRAVAVLGSDRAAPGTLLQDSQWVARQLRNSEVA